MLAFVETSWSQQALGLIVIALAVWAVVREYDVRLILLVAALLLGAIAGNPQGIVRTFLQTFVNEKFVVPLCTALGFAWVLKYTGCDQHLVHLLTRPLTRMKPLLIPGTVLAGFLVNMPVVSQTSTAVALGSVVIPLLRSAGITPLTTGAALLLGSSIGGELLNPSAPELLTTFQDSQKAARTAREKYDPEAFTPDRCVQRIVPLNFLGLAVGTLAFWWRSLRTERQAAATASAAAAKLPSDPFQVNWFKAAVPLLPLVFLYLSSYPFEVIQIDQAWLQTPTSDGRLTDQGRTRLIGFAMLLGVVAATCATPYKGPGVAAAFFEGAGYGFAHIISLIVAATCFGHGIEAIGIAKTLGDWIEQVPGLLLPCAGILPLAFAALCGSGMASTQSLFGFFAGPALEVAVDPTHVGAVVSIASAAGRTMSPVAAVTLMCARMTDTKPLDLAKQVALPLLISIAVVIVVAMIIAPTP